MLYSYRQEVQQIISDIKTEEIAPHFLDSYINKARLQVALQAQCIRNYANITFPAGTQTLPFTSIVTTGPNNGIKGVLNIRMVAYSIATGQLFLRPRSFEWFFLYKLGNPNPIPQQTPTEWSQQGQGASGTMWIAPTLINDTLFNLDVACYANDLVSDADFDAIPVPWTEAVPFWAARLAYLQADNSERAEKMLDRFEELMKRARSGATSEVNSYIYPQIQDPVRPNQLGLGGQQSA
jgi:hypothetical protein